jgi:prolyl oligopeptidase
MLSKLTRCWYYSLPLFTTTLSRPARSFSLLPAIATTFVVSPRTSFSSRMSSTTTTTDTDPYIWLEDVEAEECLDFAKKANEKCLEALGDPKTSDTNTYERVLDVLESVDRIPHVSSNGVDEQGNFIFYNFWKDKDHPKGIWRKTSLAEYKKEKKEDISWTTVLDVDALCEQDGISWVWGGSTNLPRARDPMSRDGQIVTRTLLSLSRGGSDATHVKEFDLLQGTFVSADDNAFILPEAKTRVSYKSRNVLLVGTDSGPDSLTDSGYPRTVREWVRGTKLEDAPIIFEGDKKDVSVGSWISDERTFGGGIWQCHSRSLTFYTSKYWLAKLEYDHLLAPEEREQTTLKDPVFTELDIPEDAEMSLHGNLLIISLRSDWTPTSDDTYKSGSVVYCNLEDFLNNGKANVKYHVLFQPTERTAYEYFTCTKNYVVLSTMDNVKSKLEFYKLGDNGSSLTLVGADSTARIRDCSVRPIDATTSDEFWFTTSDYVTPSALFLADASKVETNDNKKDDVYIVEQVKSLPSQYDSANLITEQRTAISKDGTEIPYFIVMKKGTVLNGKNPTLLYGYGGFEISLTPHYIASTGLAWLERGGIYIEANIRGGGEFGPKWHQAGLKANRNKCYEDFIAVGEHLIESKICTPKTLAARGGSNGECVAGVFVALQEIIYNSFLFVLWYMMRGCQLQWESYLTHCHLFWIVS